MTYTLSGDDAALFDIDADGKVTFKAAPDFEAPADLDHNNVYKVIVTADDGVTSTPKNVAITVTDVNDKAPVFTSGVSADFDENGSGTVYDANATDADGFGSLTFTLSGADEACSTSMRTRRRHVQGRPGLRGPGGCGPQQCLRHIVTASDGVQATAQNVAITVKNLNEASPVFTSGTSADFSNNGTGTAYTASATDADNLGPLTYTLTGGADVALFDINTTTGAVTFKAAPDFAAPKDAGLDNVYNIVVTASDGTKTMTRMWRSPFRTTTSGTAPRATTQSSAASAWISLEGCRQRRTRRRNRQRYAQRWRGR